MRGSVLVVGAGPAGMSAALWLRDLELPFRWVESEKVPGGTLRRVGNTIDNLLGVPSMPGYDLAATLVEDCATRGLAPETELRVSALERGEDGWSARLSDGSSWNGSSVLLCTGTRPRMLGLDAERTHLGRGVEISVTRTRERYRGLDTVVVGGGDAALEGALILAKVARTVSVVHRGGEFSAQHRFVERAERAANVRAVLGRTVREIATADDEVTGVSLDDGTEIAASGVFVRIGVQPALPVGAEECLGRDGYVDADVHGRTGLPGVYAAGDLVSRDHQSVSWSIGSAGRAVRAIHDDHFVA